MGKSQESFSKKEREKKRRKKKQEKRERKEQRKLAKADNGKKTFEDMLSYVDENGNLTSTPPDPKKKKVIKAEDIIVGVPPSEKTKEDPIRKGRVKFFNDEKGYGFIIDDDNQQSIFVHANDLDEPVEEDGKVTFEVEMGMKGPAAVRVKIIQ